MATVERLETELTAVSAGFLRSMAQVESAGSSVILTLGAVAAASVAMSVALVGSAVAAAVDFEDALADAGAKASATADEMAALENAAVDAGLAAAFSAQEAAEALGFLAQAGLDVNQQIEALPGILSLASAGNLDLAQSADIATNVLSGMGLAVDQLSRVNDVLAKASTSSNTSIAELGQSLSFVAPVAAGMGISIEETAASLGILANAGIKASRGGTALRSILAQIPDVAEKLGTTITTAEIASLGFAGSLDKLTKAGLGTANAMDVFGLEAGPAVLAFLTAGTGEIADFTIELENAGGAAEELARRQLDTLGGQLKILTGSVETLAIRFGQELSPALKDVTEDLISQVNALIQDEDALKDLGRQVLEAITIIADLAKTFTPLITLLLLGAASIVEFGRVISIAKRLVEFMAGSVALVTLSLSGMTEEASNLRAIMARDIRAAKEEGDKLGDSFKVAADFGDKLTTVSDAIAKALAGVADRADDATNAVKELVEVDLSKFFAAGAAGQEGFEGGVSPLGIFSPLVSAISEGPAPEFETFGGPPEKKTAPPKGRDLNKKVEQTVQELVDELSKGVDARADNREAIIKLIQPLKDLTGAAKTLDEMFTGLDDLAPTFEDSLNLAPLAKEASKKLEKELKEAAKEYDKFFKEMEKTAKAQREKAAELNDFVLSGVEDLGLSIASALGGGQVAGAISGIIGGAVEGASLGGPAGAVAGGLLAAGSSLVELVASSKQFAAVSDRVGTALEGLGERFDISAKLDVASRRIGDIFVAVIEAFEPLIEAFDADIFEIVIGALIEGVRAVVIVLLSVAEVFIKLVRVITFLPEVLLEFVADILEVLNDVAEFFGFEGLSGITETARSAADSFADFRDTLEDLDDAIDDAQAAALDPKVKPIDIENDITGALVDTLASATDEAAESMNELNKAVNESLTNVPVVFRAALRRGQASGQTEGPPGPAGFARNIVDTISGIDAPFGGGDQVGFQNNGTIQVFANDPEEFIENMKRLRFIAFGSSRSAEASRELLLRSS